MDRREACDDYIELYPDEAYHRHMHLVVDDYNISEYWICITIQKIAATIGEGEYPPDPGDMQRLTFLCGLLNFPYPEGWDEEWDKEE